MNCATNVSLTFLFYYSLYNMFCLCVFVFVNMPKVNLKVKSMESLSPVNYMRHLSVIYTTTPMSQTVLSLLQCTLLPFHLSSCCFSVKKILF